MGEVDLSRAKEIFGDALDREGPDRSAYLAGACAGDTALRARVEALLAAAEVDDPFLSGATLSDGVLGAPVPTGERPGSRIGPYRLLQQIGEGGFGVVFMADQERPVRRRVALKIIKLGMDTRAVVARFEQERQALAVLDHPNIAKVLDAGATDTGRPYFVMELVKGEAITEYCDSRSLPIRDRLELLVQVCQAVQHAHTKGIIHRDLKPSNVLVSEVDGRASARVIDFGIAKATNHRMTEKTLFTEFQQVVGTPEYMSPEQAGGSLDIDTRTDVYSLGVMLYEILTGSTPFDARELRSAAYGELQRIIREVEPPRPSTRISESGERLAGVAARRRVEPRRLGTIVRGELDWIVMKAMEKSRGRRYETASGLAADLSRYLAGEAVAAAPPTRGYRLRKFVRRNRGVVVASAVIVTGLLAGVIGAGVGLVKADAARKREMEQGQLARQQASIAQAANAFLNDMLEKANRGEQGGNAGVTVREVLDAAAADLRSGSHAYEPAVLASVHDTIGRTYQGLGLYTEAATHLREALRLKRELFGEEHVQTAGAMRTLAGLLFQKDEPAEAESLSRAALALYSSLHPADDAETAKYLAALGVALSGLRDYTRAEAEYARAVQLLRAAPGEHRAELADVLTSMGLVIQQRGDVARAESVYREVLRLRRDLGESESTQVGVVLNNLAWTLGLQGKHAEAEAMYHQVIALRRRLLGPDHPLVALSINNLGGMLQAKGEPARAEVFLREALDIRRRSLGDDSPYTIGSIENVASALQDQGRLDEAEAMFGESLALRRGAFGEVHPDVADSLGNLASLKMQRGRMTEAESLLRQAVSIRRKVMPGAHPDTASTLTSLAVVLSRLEKFDESVELMREVVEMQRRLVAEDNPEVIRAEGNYGLALLAKGDYEEAGTVLRRASARSSTAFGPENPRTLSCVGGLGTALSELAWRERGTPRAAELAAEAEGVMLECFAAREKSLGPADLTLAVTRSVLGGCVVGVEACRPAGAAAREATVQRLAHAEELLTSSYDVIEGAEGTPNSSRARLRHAAARLARLYEVWNVHDPSESHAASADRWREQSLSLQ